VVDCNVNNQVVPPRLTRLSTKSPRPILSLRFLMEAMLRRSVVIPACRQMALMASMMVSWAALRLPVSFLQAWTWSPNASMMWRPQAQTRKLLERRDRLAEELAKPRLPLLFFDGRVGEARCVSCPSVLQRALLVLRAVGRLLVRHVVLQEVAKAC